MTDLMVGTGLRVEPIGRRAQQNRPDLGDIAARVAACRAEGSASDEAHPRESNQRADDRGDS